MPIHPKGINNLSLLLGVQQQTTGSPLFIPIFPIG